MKALIPLKNPYKLKKRNFLVRFYQAYPNGSQNKIVKKLKMCRYFLYAISLIANIYGLKKLNKKKHALLQASLAVDENKKFRIRDTNSQFHSIYFSCYENCYEPDVSAVVETFLTENSVFIDIGSNWGHHSFNAILNKKAKAFLFEPNPDVFDDINRIAADLGVTSHVNSYNVALSDKESHLTLEQHYFESGIGSISKSFSDSPMINNRYLAFLKNCFKLSSITHLTEVKTLDSFSLVRADLVKIDAEGVEIEILRGARKTLQELKPFVVFEFHSGDLSCYDQYKSFFESIEYDLYTLVCAVVDQSKALYELRILPVEALEANHQYNLFAASKNTDFEGYATTRCVDSV